MNLFYRGNAYQVSELVTDAVETKQIGQFLGKPFSIKHCNVAGRHTNPVTLTYRGFHYNP